jgi:hypothetical protein
VSATPQEMGHTQRLFDGRIEKRLPMAVPVYVTSAKEPRDREKTLTQNICPHGARLVSQRFWRPGEEPLVTPLTGEFPQPARVVYCQPSAKAGFCVGLKFPGRSVKWGGWPSG